MRTSDIHWLAGLVEGEGCFVLANGKYIRLQLDMTDRDVVERAAHLLGARAIWKPHIGKHSKKQSFRFAIQGPQAIGWMMTLYGLMGTRRQSRIRECLHAWRIRTDNYHKTFGNQWGKPTAKAKATLTKQALEPCRCND